MSELMPQIPRRTLSGNEVGLVVNRAAERAINEYETVQVEGLDPTAYTNGNLPSLKISLTKAVREAEENYCSRCYLYNAPLITPLDGYTTPCGVSIFREGATSTCQSDEVFTKRNYLKRGHNRFVLIENP